MGGQVVYLPPTPSFGGNLGTGISQGLSKYSDLELKRQMDQQEMEGTMKAIQAVKAAGSRDKALQILTDPSITHFRDAKQLDQARQYVDVIYPIRDETPTMVTGYNTKTGEKQEAYVPKNQLGSQQAILHALGPDSTLTKPDLTDYFMQSPPGEITSLGRRPRTDQQPGEYQKDQLELMLKEQSDKRAAEGGMRADNNAARADNTQARVADTEAQKLLLMKQNAYKGHVADNLNVKRTTGNDGSINIDLSGSTPETIIKFNKAMGAYDENIAKSKGDVLKASVLATKEFDIAQPSPPKAPEPVKAKEKTYIEKARDMITGKSEDTMVFKTEAEAQAAEKTGKLKKNTKVTIGGVAGTWQ